MDADLKAALAEIRTRIDRLSLAVQQLAIGEIIMSQEMDSLQAQVTANTTIEQSALTLIQGIAAQVADAAGDRSKTLALANTLKASGDALAAAIAANTPAAPPV